MTPVTQDLAHQKGNCLQAAVASILDLPLAEVPDWSASDESWFEDMVRWANDLSLGVVCFQTNTIVPEMYNTWVVAGGKSPRSDSRDHAVIALANTNRDTKILELSFVHDPYPTREFIKSVEYCFFFTKQ